VYICLCRGIKETDVRELGRAGVVCPEALTTALGVDQEDCCGRCARNIEELVALATSELDGFVKR
jgi:bacterioferritin-associated ferredoxin